MARYIDADIAKETLSAHEDRKGYIIGDFEQIIDEDVPTADVRENIHAYWKPVHLTAFGVCSACGSKWQFTEFMSFCPNCGARMCERGRRMKLKYYSGAQVTSIIEKLPSKEYIDMLNAFAKEPSADVVEVVRCKECVHHKNAPKTTDVWCERVDGLLPTDWFCADGERRDDD